MLKNYEIQAKVINRMPYKDQDEFIVKLGDSEFLKRIDHAMDADVWLVGQILKSTKLKHDKK